MKVLIVVDMQNDFVTGALGTPEAEAIVPNVVAKIKEYHSIAGSEIVLTRDTHTAKYRETLEGKNLPILHCVRGTPGWRFCDEIEDVWRKELSFIYTVEKSSFGTLDWEEYVGPYYNIESIELVGVCTDICVISNALILKAMRPEVEIIVDASCCAGTTPENHKAALQVMKSCQINVIGE